MKRWIAVLLGFSMQANAQMPDLPSFLPGRAHPMTAADASRLLAQGTFGPTFPEIERAQTMGADGWVQEQLALPPSSHLAFLDSVAFAPIFAGDNVRMEAWLQRALYAPDQLRQRVAFALSQIFVVSETLPALSNQPEGLASYYDVLVDGAFGSYRELLGRVARHPAMGIYLSMRGNRKADEAARIKPDENFARESMQLFSVGLWMLNPDGTTLDGDPAAPGVQPIPAYDQKAVGELARVYTGWNWPSCATIPESRAAEWPACGGSGEWRVAMAPTEWAHDRDAKRLLSHEGAGRGTPLEIAAGLDADVELDLALDHIAAHPNVGPFLSRQLIQRLVTSNPSPAYVERVARVFADDGYGQRGNLGAVVAAILLDEEARSPDLADHPHYGKLREPLLRRTHIARALDVKTFSGRIEFVRGPRLFGTGQGPLASPSVFNFYRPDYAPPGDVTAAGLVAPEFTITTEADIIRETDAASSWMSRSWQRWISVTLEPHQAPHTPFADLLREVTFAASGHVLADRYELLFMGGRMPQALRDEIAAVVDAMPGTGEGALIDRASVALTLVLSSPAYAIQK